MPTSLWTTLLFFKQLCHGKSEGVMMERTGPAEERERAQNRVKGCVSVCVLLPSTANLCPTRMGFLWLKKVKGEYNDIKTWWLHLGSDQPARQQLPDRARAGGKEKETEKTREGEEAREKQHVGTNAWNKGWVLQILERILHKALRHQKEKLFLIAVFIEF